MWFLAGSWCDTKPAAEYVVRKSDWEGEFLPNHNSSFSFDHFAFELEQNIQLDCDVIRQDVDIY